MSAFENYSAILQEALSKNYDSSSVVIDMINEREKELLKQIANIVLDYNNAGGNERNVYEMFHRIKKSMAHISKDCGKNSPFCFVVLHLIYNVIPHSFLKYQDINSFLSAYPNFGYYDERDVKTLCRVANWMIILFNLIPAKKNKGLILAAVTKFVEGPGVNYITGSGQKKTTSHRVFIYETEGNVSPEKRTKDIVKEDDDVTSRPNNETVSMVNVALFHDDVPDNEPLTGYPSLAVERDFSLGLPDDVIDGLGMGKDDSFPWSESLTTVKGSSFNTNGNQLLSSECKGSLDFDMALDSLLELLEETSLHNGAVSPVRDISLDETELIEDMLRSFGAMGHTKDV
jgi:hypothetical protein